MKRPSLSLIVDRLTAISRFCTLIEAKGIPCAAGLSTWPTNAPVEAVWAEQVGEQSTPQLSIKIVKNPNAIADRTFLVRPGIDWGTDLLEQSEGIMLGSPT